MNVVNKLRLDLIVTNLLQVDKIIAVTIVGVNQVWQLEKGSVRWGLIRTDWPATMADPLTQLGELLCLSVYSDK